MDNRLVGAWNVGHSDYYSGIRHFENNPYCMLDKYDEYMHWAKGFVDAYEEQYDMKWKKDD